VVQNSPSIHIAGRDVAEGLTFGNNVDKQDHSQRIESIGAQESGTAGCRAREILPADKKYRGHGSRENRRGVRAVDEPTSATVRSVLRKDKDGAGCGQDCEGGVEPNGSTTAVLIHHVTEEPFELVSHINRRPNKVRPDDTLALRPLAAAHVHALKERAAQELRHRDGKRRGHEQASQASQLEDRPQVLEVQ
jgi:hypothetical protein